MEAPRQPLLHELVASLHSPTLALSGRDGQVRAEGAQGVFSGDLRVLSRAEVTVAGDSPEAIASGPLGAGRSAFSGLVRGLGDPGADPTVRLDRTRTMGAGSMAEELRLVSTAAEPVAALVVLELSADLAPMDLVKHGRTGVAVPMRVTGPGALSWGDGAPSVRIRAAGADATEVDSGARLSWPVKLPARGEVTLRWELEVRDHGAVVGSAPSAPSWTTPRVVADDRRLPALVTQSLADLDGLRMAPVDAPRDVFLAAGAPWFFTLFGRDSLWAARMLLPLGTDLAAGTLRVLAARQGTRVDPRTAEAPGKIPHELRRTATAHDHMALPPLYYGTVDATPLWLCLLHDAWRWGMPESDVEQLLPAAEAALAWMDDYGDPDGDGFLEYVDESGVGLANQGWKDSGDSVRFRDGTLGRPPVALCEVQGYAYEAAVSGASLLDHFGRPGADRWRECAAALAGRFRERFWVADTLGPYPALAIDGDARQVDALTSNAGHLLGTGLLSGAEEELVARRLIGPDMSSGYGLRTMSTTSAAYSPLSYHCGSVWPHDTTIVVAGMARAGLAALAGPLVEGLLAAGTDFAYRLPELYSGDARGSVPQVVPYPAACRPQAWAAASAVVLLQTALGLSVDVPAGRISARPPFPFPTGAVRAEGLVAGGEALTVEVDRDGDVVELTGTAALSVG